METKPKNRAWVKDAAIVFLVVLLLLTFFSNTIMNHSLPEVATVMVSNGTITAKVRGTGTVSANGDHKVKAKSGFTIGKVMVKAGQEVNAGDVLFVLGAGDSDELEEAKIALEDLQVQYSQAALSVPLLKDQTGTNAKIAALAKDVQSAQRTMTDLGERLDVSSDKIQNLLTQKDSALAELEVARAAYDVIDNELLRLKAEADSAENYYDGLIVATPTPAATPESEPTPSTPSSPEPSPTDSTETKTNEESTEETNQSNSEGGGEPKVQNVGDVTIKTVTASYIVSQSEKDAAYNDWQSKKAIYDKYEADTKNEYNGLKTKIDSLDVKVKSINEALENISTGSGDSEKGWSDYLAAKRAYEDAVDAYNTAVAEKNYSSAEEQRSVASASVGLSSISNKIKRQQDKIKKLSGEGDENTVTANVSGTITEVNCTAGDTVVKDDILASIEVPDQGYTVSFSVTNDQAKRLRIGDTATISNYYWGNKIVATLSGIQTDKKNPMTNKTLTFDLEGDVTSGSEITVSVGQKSANYDIIIPNSAIRTDSNGSFVLAVTAKNSPLGNRYIAKRVAIEVLAADDNNSAVTADLNNGDYVITTSSAPIATGDMVRLANEEN